MKVLLALFLSCLGSHAAVLRDLAYVPGGDALQKLDLYLPEKKGAGAPVLVAIHGGGWAFGDKDNHGFVKPKMQWFNGQGFIVASINYRLSPKVSHPAHIEDVCKAVAWVEKNIAVHGGDPTRIYLIGHSAGAHLAALAAVDDAKLKAAGARPEFIRGVILLDGAAYDVAKQMAATVLPRRDNMYTRAFTHDAEVQRDASPTLKVAQLKRVPPPFLILHVADRKDAKNQAMDLSAAIMAKQGKAQVVGIEGKTHGTINSDLGKPGDATTLAVEQFLKQIR